MKDLQMLRSGLDTLSIASKTGQTEAQTVGVDLSTQPDRSVEVVGRVRPDGSIEILAVKETVR